MKLWVEMLSPQAIRWSWRFPDDEAPLDVETMPQDPGKRPDLACLISVIVASGGRSSRLPGRTAGLPRTLSNIGGLDQDEPSILMLRFLAGGEAIHHRAGDREPAAVLADSRRRRRLVRRQGHVRLRGRCDGRRPSEADRRREVHRRGASADGHAGVSSGHRCMGPQLRRRSRALLRCAGPAEAGPTDTESELGGRASRAL